MEAKASIAGAEPGPRLSTWGHFQERYQRQTQLDVALAEKSKIYRFECLGRITRSWKAIFEEELGPRKVSSITQEQCMMFAASMTGYHSITYNNTIAVFKHVLELAVDAGYLLANPAFKLKRIGRLPRVHGATIGEPGEPLTAEEREDLETPDQEEVRWYPTPDEFRAIVAKMRSYQFGPCQAAALFAELLAFTGCRLSEARRVRWSDVDWPRNRIRVHGAKGRRTSTESSVRYVPIHDSLAELLRRLGGRPHGPADKLVSVAECRGTLQRACDDLKMPRRLDHHDLRHCFATWAVAAGVPVPVTADWLGHKDGGALLLKVYRHKDEAVNQAWAKQVKL